MNMVYRVLGLMYLIICGMAAVELATAQDERAIRRIVVADRQTAEEILQQLRQGASFSALAGTRSVGGEHSQWGYSGIVRLREIQPVLRAALLKLKEGQISDILEVGGQFVILKMISPKIPRHFEAAERAEREGKLPQAIQEIQAALRLEEDNMQAYIKLGCCNRAPKSLMTRFGLSRRPSNMLPRRRRYCLWWRVLTRTPRLRATMRPRLRKPYRCINRYYNMTSAMLQPCTLAWAKSISSRYDNRRLL